MVKALWVLIAVGEVANAWYCLPKMVRVARQWCEQHPQEAARMNDRERANAGRARRYNFMHAWILAGLIVIGGIGTGIIKGQL